MAVTVKDLILHLLAKAPLDVKVNSTQFRKYVNHEPDRPGDVLDLWYNPEENYLEIDTDPH